MSAGWSNKNNVPVTLVAFFCIVVIGYLDYITGTEFGFSFFYLIPISFLSLYRNTKIWTILLCSFLASLLWFTSKFLVEEYSHIFFPVWNAFIRLIIFSTIGLLIYYLKEKEEQLRLINSNLKKINEEKDKFIGIAAHDLRSPISGIYSFAELLIERYNEQLDPEILSILENIYKTSGNSLSILENLLDISKIESGKVIINFKTQDYIAFINQHITLNQILARNKNIMIINKSEYETLSADFDEHYLGEVADNILSNAIKYSHWNSEITVEVTVDSNNQILTEVTDTGTGIAEAEQQNLFRYFQTTSSRPTDGEKSTGLGLAISKHIILLHHGSIGFKSVQDKGSVFYYRLPVKQ